MKKFLLNVILVLSLCGLLMAAIEDNTETYTVAGTTDVTDTGTFYYISIYNEGPSLLTVTFYRSGSLQSTTHEIPAGVSWCPPNGCKLNGPRSGYRLASANATVYVSIQ